MNAPTNDHPATYPNESVGSRMSENVPIFTAHTKFKSIENELFSKAWDSVSTIYVVDEHHKLVGIVDIAKTETSNPDAALADIMAAPPAVLHPRADQEKAVYLAIRDDIVAVPVTDKHGVLLGAVTSHAIIDIMHEEHIEDTMLGAGVRDKHSNVLKLIQARTTLLVRSRTPWLIIGLVLSMMLGLIASFFEETLEKSIALAFFIPVIVYIADSVGTQSSTITVRALAMMKLKYGRYIVKELLVGMVLGVIMGALGAVGAFIISQSMDVALVVALTLLCASTIASVLASAVPITLKSLGKDPAMGSGPLATVLQDILSLVIYFLFAILIIGS